MPTHEFRGKTEGDIEIQFREWQAEMAGKVANVRRQPLQGLPLVVQSASPLYHKLARDSLADQFLLLVEYDLLPESKKPRATKVGRRRQKK